MSYKLTPKNGFIIAACLAAVSLIFSLTLAFCLPSGGKEDTESSSEYETEERNRDVTTSLDYTYKTDISAYAEALNTTDEKYLLLANKVYLIGEEYQPTDIVDLDTSLTLHGKEISLVEYAAKASEALILELRANGYNDVYITSGYRSYAYQQTLYSRYFEKEKKAHPTWSDEQIKAEVLTYSAYPGTSEHQSGLCMDLFVYPGMSELVNYGYETGAEGDCGFAETEAYKWLKDNAHKFGFILRYPADKVDITGYSYESWHYRFVGIDAATEIYDSGATLEEYLGKVK